MDGGKTWQPHSITELAATDPTTLEFRSIHAWDAERA